MQLIGVGADLTVAVHDSDSYKSDCGAVSQSNSSRQIASSSNQVGL